jgi:WD40 repeat protein
MFHKDKEFSGHGAGIYSLAFDGQFIYSASADHYVARWNLASGEQDRFAIKFDFPVYSIALLNQNNFLAVGLSSGDLHLFDLVKRVEVKFFKQHTKALFCIVENSVKQQFYTADADGNLAIWDSSSFDLLLYLPLDAGKIRRIAVNASGEHFAVACQDGTIRIFETSYFNEIHTFQAHEGGTTAIVFNPMNENELFSGGKDAHICQWNWREEKHVKHIAAHNFIVYDLKIDPSENLLISGSRDKTVKVWNLSDLTIHQRLDLTQKGHRHSVNALQIINETTFVSASDDKRIICWKRD